MNKVGIYFAYWTDRWEADFVPFTHKVARLGFDVLEIQPASLLDKPKSALSDLKKAADDEGLTLTYCIGFTKDKDMASPDPSVRRAGIEYAKRILDLMGFMDGKVLGGIIYSSWPSSLPEEATDKRPYFDRSVASVKEVIKTAEDNGILYCLEVVNRFEQYLLNTAAEAVDYCNAVGSPNIKVMLDVFHMNIEEDSMRGAILTAGDKLGHFHLGETNRRPPGQGRMPWDEICGALRDINYQGALVMEPFIKMGGQVGRDIRVWRDLSNGADETEVDRQAKEAAVFMRRKLQQAAAAVSAGTPAD